MQKLDNVVPINSCRGCMYASDVPSNVVGQWVGLCIYNPPQAVAIPTINPMGKRGMNISPVFPPVNDKIVCAQYTDREQTETPGA